MGGRRRRYQVMLTWRMAIPALMGRPVILPGSRVLPLRPCCLSAPGGDHRPCCAATAATRAEIERSERLAGW